LPRPFRTIKITSIETIALRDERGGNAVSWNIDSSAAGYDLTLIRVHTDKGLTGIGYRR